MSRILTHLSFLLVFICSTSSASDTRQAAIASAHPLATEAGFEILQQGGNAFDAAIAVTAALAVVEPAGSGLGGGGFWLLHRATDQHEIMIDGRETAPAAAHRDMYLNDDGEFDKHLSLDGASAAGIPGVPAALDHLSRHYGNLSLSQSLAPAIRYARQGFKVSPHYQRLVGFRSSALLASKEASEIFLDEGQIPELESLIKQENLATTLEKIALQGRDGFYRGDTANKLVKAVQHSGGIWTLDDLAHYQIKERPVIRAQYHDYQISSAALPSSGGIVLTSILNQLETLPYSEAESSQKKHFIIEAMKRAFFDRSRYLGDSDFVEIPDHLTSKTYAKQLASTINPSQSTASEQLTIDNKGEDTSHFSIIDQFGNRVSATLSINYPFGSGFVPEGTGVLLNDEMDDFSAQVGVANVYGLLGNEANAIEANKRPLSSMTPTFIENDQHLMVIGTPGGSRIITMVLLGVLDFIDGKTAEQIVATPRYHHQYSPDVVQIEVEGFGQETIEELASFGHQIDQLDRQYGNMQLVIFDKQTEQLTAASDPRGEGLAAVKVINNCSKNK
jgi:gamma-glutamyltranspeptidase/glutathione hydrolase